MPHKQSAHVQRAAHAEHQSLADAAKVETEASRRELIIAQTLFQEASSQQTAQTNSLRNALSHTEMRDSAVREDLRCLRTESESYSQLLGRAEQNWQLMQTGTRTADQLIRTQRSELNAALSELSVNQGATNKMYGQFAALEQAQASANAECRWLNAQLRTERRPAPSPDVGPGPDAHEERFIALTRRFDEFQLTVDHTLYDVQ